MKYEKPAILVNKTMPRAAVGADCGHGNKCNGPKDDHDQVKEMAVST